MLDIAAGAGGQTLSAARRVGNDGAVLATDLAPAILDYAEREARAAGLANVAVRAMDAEALDLEPGSFDAAICRLGLMYLPSLPAALASVRRALRPGGRLAAIVFSTPDRNGFFSVPVGIIRRRAGLGAPVAGQPGPFSLGASGVLAGALAAAGFGAIEVRALDAPLRLPTAADCLRLEQESFGALHQMLSGLDDAGPRGGVGRGRDGARRLRGSRRLRGPVRAAGGRRDRLARQHDPLELQQRHLAVAARRCSR